MRRAPATPSPSAMARPIRRSPRSIPRSRVTSSLPVAVGVSTSTPSSIRTSTRSAIVGTAPTQSGQAVSSTSPNGASSRARFVERLADDQLRGGRRRRGPRPAAPVARTRRRSRICPDTTGAPTATSIEPATSCVAGLRPSSRISASAIAVTGAGSTARTVAGRGQPELEGLDLLPDEGRRIHGRRRLAERQPSRRTRCRIRVGRERGRRSARVERAVRAVELPRGRASTSSWRDLRELLVRATGGGIGIDDLQGLGVLALRDDHDRVRLDVPGRARARPRSR